MYNQRLGPYAATWDVNCVSRTGIEVDSSGVNERPLYADFEVCR